jgi:NDP-sugar pyrophosphorylase family protein
MIEEEGKFSIIDLYLRLAKTEKLIAFEDTSELWFDLGKPHDLERAKNYVK